MRTARIIVDGIEVVSIPAERYFQIEGEVKSELKTDFRFIAFTVLSHLLFLSKSAYTTIKVSAFGLFVVAVFMSMTKPDMVVEFFSGLSKSEPQQLATLIHYMAWTWVTLSATLTALGFICVPESLEYREKNRIHFNRLTNLRLLEILKVPSDSAVDVKILLEPETNL